MARYPLLYLLLALGLLFFPGGAPEPAGGTLPQALSQEPQPVRGALPEDGCEALPGGSRWVTATVDQPRTFQDMRDNSLALDAAGRPHVAYGGDHLYYAYRDGAGWHTTAVDSGLQVGVYASLALDAAGRPHIAYYDQDTDTLRYAYHDGTAWRLQAVDADDGMC